MSEAAFTPTTRTQVRRMPKRGHYDRETVHAILDAGAIAHVGYVIDGQPYVTPTAYWRKGERIYWHGSSANRMLRTIDAGSPVCVEVSHIDGFVLARSAFHHSVNYRSVIVLGRAREVTDDAAKRRFLDALVDRVAPGRAAQVRGPSAKELAATRVLAMPIEEASAKIRTGGPVDDEDDLRWPVWAGQLPVGLRSMSHIPTPDDAPQYPTPARPLGVD